MKSVNIPEGTDAGTIIAGYAGQTLTVAQLQTLLGVVKTPPNTQTPTGGGGSSGSGTLALAPGLVGGGALVGNVPLRINKQQAAAMFCGGGGDDDGGGGSVVPGKRGKDGVPGGIGPTGPAGTPGGPRGHAIATVVEPEDPPTPMLIRGPRGFQGNPGVSGVSRNRIWMPQSEEYEEPMFVGRAKASIGGTVSSLVNITPDTHPASPTVFDDEFESGTVIDTTGARRSGANPWVIFGGSSANYPVANGSVGATSGTNAAVQTLPAGSWTFVTKIWWQNSSQQGGLLIGNRTTGKAYNIFQFTSNAWDIQLGTINATTWAYAFSSNLTINNALISVQIGWAYIQVAYNGTTLTVSASSSGLPGTFVGIAPRTVATDLGGAPLEIGLGLAGYAQQWDWFRRTA